MKYLFFISCFLLSMPTLEGVNSHQPPSIISSSKARNNKSTPIKQKSAKKNIRPFKLVKWIFLGGKKQRNKKAFNANDISFISGITSVVSVLVLFGISNPFFLFVSIVGGLAAVISGIIGLVNKKTGRKKGWLGFLMGLGVLLFWTWVILSIGEF